MCIFLNSVIQFKTIALLFIIIKIYYSFLEFLIKSLLLDKIGLIQLLTQKFRRFFVFIEKNGLK